MWILFIQEAGKLFQMQQFNSADAAKTALDVFRKQGRKCYLFDQTYRKLSFGKSELEPTNYKEYPEDFKEHRSDE